MCTASSRLNEPITHHTTSHNSVPLKNQSSQDSRIQSTSTALIPYRPPVAKSPSQRTYELLQKSSLTTDEARELASLVRDAYQKSDHLQKFYSENRNTIPRSLAMSLPPDHYEDRLIARSRRSLEGSRNAETPIALPPSLRVEEKSEAPQTPPPSPRRGSSDEVSELPSKKTEMTRRLGIEPYHTNKPFSPHWGDTF